MSNVGGRSFSSVRKAREALKQRADEILTGFLETIIEARKAGKYEEALKAQQWLLERIRDEDGSTLVEASVDKQQKQVEGPVGPAIYISGITIGGKKELPPPASEVIDITPNEPDSRT